MGMLVTLFLSLTALLVSTISSSPEVTNHKQNKIWRNLFVFGQRYKWSNMFDDHKRMNFMNSGVPRHICPNLLGACSLFLHLRCNRCLWKSTCHTQVKISFSLQLCNLRRFLYVSPFVGSVTDQKPFILGCATISLGVLDIHSRIWKYLPNSHPKCL